MGRAVGKNVPVATTHVRDVVARQFVVVTHALALETDFSVAALVMVTIAFQPFLTPGVTAVFLAVAQTWVGCAHFGWFAFTIRAALPTGPSATVRSAFPAGAIGSATRVFVTNFAFRTGAARTTASIVSAYFPGTVRYAALTLVIIADEAFGAGATGDATFVYPAFLTFAGARNTLAPIADIEDR